MNKVEVEVGGYGYFLEPHILEMLLVFQGCQPPTSSNIIDGGGMINDDIMHTVHDIICEKMAYHSL